MHSFPVHSILDRLVHARHLDVVATLAHVVKASLDVGLLCIDEVQTCPLRRTSYETIIFVSKMSQIFNCEKLLHVIVYAPLIDLLLHSGTLRDGGNDIMDQIVEFGTAKGSIILISSATGIREHIIPRQSS